MTYTKANIDLVQGDQVIVPMLADESVENVTLTARLYSRTNANLAELNESSGIAVDVDNLNFTVVLSSTQTAALTPGQLYWLSVRAVDANSQQKTLAILALTVKDSPFH